MIAEVLTERAAGDGGQLVLGARMSALCRNLCESVRDSLADRSEAAILTEGFCAHHAQQPFFPPLPPGLGIGTGFADGLGAGFLAMLLIPMD